MSPLERDENIEIMHQDDTTGLSEPQMKGQ